MGNNNVINIFLLLSFLVFVATLTIFPIEDADIWFHLAHGRWIAEQGLEVPQVDPFSWPIPNLSIVSKTTGLIWEWLTEIGVYFLFHNWGPSAIIITKAFVIILAFLSLLVIASRLGTPLYISISFLTLGVLASAERFLVRLEHIGNLYLVVMLGILYLLKKGTTTRFTKALLLSLPLLFLIWTNTHGSVSLGLVILWLFTITSFLSKHSFRWRLVVIALISTSVLIINPYGKSALTFALDWGGAISGKSLYLLKTYEWMAPLSGFHKYQIYVTFFKILLVVYWVAFAYGFYKRKASFFGFIVLLLATYLSLSHTRNINVFVILGFLPAVEALASLKLESSTLYKGVAFFLMTAGFVFGTYSVVTNGYRLGTTYRTVGLGVKPIVADGVINFLNEQNISGNMLNQFEIGGYLMFVSPERKVFIDGRTHYPEWFFKEYLSMGSLPEKARAIFDKYNVDFAVVMHPEGESETSVPRYLSESREWALAYWDNLYLVYLRKTKQYLPIIENLEYLYADPIKLSDPAILTKIESESLLKDNTVTELERTLEKDPTNIRAHLLLGGILENSDDLEAAQVQYEKAIKVDPKHALAHLMSAGVYIKKEDYAKAQQELKLSLKFNPNLAFAYLLLGEIGEKNKDYREAIGYYKKSLGKNPNLAAAYFRLGAISAGPQYNRKKAQEYLLQALRSGLNEEQALQAKQILQQL